MTQRIFKFRAWDNENKFYMSYSDDWNDYHWSEFLNPPEDNEKRYELMQYTGLKDKNGKEIYEGDLIKVDAVDIRIVRNGIVRIPDNEDYGENTISGFYLEDTGTKFPRLSHIDQLDMYRVVGNIYENNNLLKNDKEIPKSI